MLEVKNLSKTYLINKNKISALQNININIDDRKLIWIYGNSGSGKTTFLNMISGIDKADMGSVKWDEKDIVKLSNYQKCEFRLKNMGLVFQFFDMIKTQTLFSNVAIPLKFLNKSRDEIFDKVNKLLKMFDIEKLAYKKPKHLSGGERQRGAIARALITQPKIIIADEITASLDAQMSKKIYKIIKDYIVENNAIGVFVSHDPIIKEFADETYLMLNGSLIKTEYVND